ALHKSKPVLIFLDLLMPHTNGYELCASLRRTTLFRDVPIIILTGQDGIVDRVRAKLVGASEFLSKPPDKARVESIIRKYLQPAI
ncbi:MAG: response regulator, partial [Synechococcaceae cyanobacterium SM2_3_2]|nr:response regulator [Synechococcaceae cyanobacterium SM2_3_2]